MNTVFMNREPDQGWTKWDTNTVFTVGTSIYNDWPYKTTKPRRAGVKVLTEDRKWLEFSMDHKDIRQQSTLPLADRTAWAVAMGGTIKN